MAYKILINSKGVPVLVEVQEKIRKSLGVYDFVYPSLKLEYEQAISTALSDEKNHIPVKDELSTIALLIENNRRSFFGGEYVIREWCRSKIGQTFDLPENIGVSFDWSTCENDICLCTYFEKSDCGYTRKLAILTPKENSDHSFTEGEASEQKDTADIKCPFCNQGGFDKPGLKYHINVYCVDYMNTEEL